MPSRSRSIPALLLAASLLAGCGAWVSTNPYMVIASPDSGVRPDAGRTYFVLLAVQSLEVGHFAPVRAGEPNPITTTGISQPTRAMQEWLEEGDHRDSARRHFDKALAAWEKLSEADRARLTLRVEDGR